MGNKHYEFLVIGQGLAGCCLAWELAKRNSSYLVLDLTHPNSASGVSAGVVNPLIGRSFNLSWNFLELNKFAQQTYSDIEQELALTIKTSRSIVRTLSNTDQVEKIIQRKTELSYKSLIGEIIYEYPNIQLPFAAFFTNQSYVVDIQKLVAAFKIKLEQDSRLHTAKLSYQDLTYQQGKYHYQDLIFDKVIFAEGYRAIENPFASFLTFRPAKGEILDIEISGLNLTNILNFGHFLLPLGEDRYRLGATYSWDHWESKPELTASHPLLTALAEICDLPYKVVDHRFGVRPIVSGQKPVIGKHPELPEMYFLNGLGSKGALQAPYCAKMLINSILDNKIISPEVSTNRFFR